MKNILIRALGAIMTALIVACGGGGGGIGSVGVGVGVGVSGVGDGKGLTHLSSPIASPSSASETYASAPDWGFAGQASINDHGGPGVSSSDASTGTGTSGSNGSGNSGTSTAAAGDTGGVGSGGTGASASTGDSADSGVGAVGGVASIIVNGVRYSTEGAILKLRDAPQLQIGMTAKVNGPTNADFTSGKASEVESAADARGVIDSIDAGRGEITLLGMKITTDSATVWGNVAGMEALTSGVTIQVWGLPTGPNALRATRIERLPSGPPIISGQIRDIDVGRRTFRLGGLGVEFSQAPLPAGSAVGVNVRVRASAQPVSGLLHASSIELWYPVSLRDGTRRQLGGTVTDFQGISNFRVLGTPVDASTAQVSGGSVAMIADGVDIDVAGTITNGKLVATKIKIKKTPGGTSAASFTAIGTVGAFKSLADFKIKGQAIDASGNGVQFQNGAASGLGNGSKVSVVGERIVNDVLIATQVTFN